MAGTREAIIRWKDTGDTELVTVAYPLDVRDDDDNIFFYFNDEESIVDAMRKDTVHDFTIVTLFE